MRQAGLAILLGFAAAAAWCQPGPGTAEFQVNTPGNDFPYSPAVAQNAAGEFVVAWLEAAPFDASGPYFYPVGLLAQRFDSAGQRQGGELRVNTLPFGEYGFHPDVAVDGDGRFLVVWGGEHGEAGTGTFVRRYGIGGEPLGEQEKIGEIGVPALAGDEEGNALAIWSHPQDGPQAISGRLFDAASESWQEPFAIQEDLGKELVPASVALDPTGGFVVVWRRDEDVLARRFSATGEEREGELVVNQVPAMWPRDEFAREASVGAAGDGGFVVAWTHQGGGFTSVHARRFDAAGEPRGDEATLTSGVRLLGAPTVAVDAAGEYLVAWQRVALGGEGLLVSEGGVAFHLAGRWFDAAGNARGGEFPLVYGARASVYEFDLAMNPAGRLAVAFYTGDIYGRLLPPAARGGVLQLAEEPFALPWSALVEDEVTVDVQVVRTGGVTGRVSVEHFTAGGSATAGEDYTSTDGRLVFAEGEYQKSFPLRVHEDEDTEGNETLTVGLRDPKGALLREPTAFTVTLFDDESTLPGEGPYPRGEKLRVARSGFLPRVAMREDGTFLVVWASGTGPWSLLGQLYGADGQADGAPLLISADSELGWPGVAALPGGDFLIAWTGDMTEIRGRRITPGHRPGPVLDLASCDPDNCVRVRGGTEIAVGDDGSFAVFWANDLNPGSWDPPQGFFEGQIFDEDANPVGGRILRNGKLLFSIAGPERLQLAVSSLGSGDFLLAWSDGDCNFKSERFGVAGPSERHDLGQICLSNPALVRPGDEGFVLFYGDFALELPGGLFGGLSFSIGDEIYGRRLDAGGAPLGEPFAVNGFSPDSQTGHRAAATPSGEHVVVWASDSEPSPGRRSIVARRYDAAGRPIGERFAVRPSDLLPLAPDVAMAPNGDFVVVWQEGTRNGGASVYAQPYVGSSCVSGGRKLCLNQGRFELAVTWRDAQGKTGDGRAVPLTDDTGAFYFFGPENLELMVKVLDGRHLTGHYWVFYGSLTNVEFTLTVTDTSNGQRKSYVNPLGRFASVGDTQALPGD